MHLTSTALKKALTYRAETNSCICGIGRRKKCSHIVLKSHTPTWHADMIFVEGPQDYANANFRHEILKGVGWRKIDILGEMSNVANQLFLFS